MDKKKKIHLYSVYKTPTCKRPKDKFRLKAKGWRIICHSNGKQKKVGVAILTSDNINFKITTVTRDEEGHCNIIKGYIHLEDQHL